MKISYNWIQEYLNFSLPSVGELVEKIGSQLGAVEEVVDLGAKYQGIVIARIESCEPVEDSDHLNLCLIDDGGAVKDVERNERGLVQVVCGAPNARAGLLVAWLPPGSTVPSSFGKDPFVLGARKLRGHISNGMIASPQELAIGDSHDGILEIDVDAQPGDSFAEVYQFNDFIIDIENKMFTHRPDCFGILGIAREIAGILGQQFYEPDWFATALGDFANSEISLPLNVQNDAPALVPRFMAVAFANVEIKPSSIRQQTLLSRVGVRPINNIVDATNYFMYLTGQPLHAYDYDKVRAVDGGDTATLIARESRPDETLTLLNGKSITLRSGAIVIATATQPIGLGGVMGGASTEVDTNTKNIILECATFEMYSIRRTSMVHGIFSEAVTRFNKGQSPLQNDRILYESIRHLEAVSGGKKASDVFDETAPDLAVNTSHPITITITSQFITERLGLEVSPTAMQTLLQNVGFQVSLESESLLQISVPFWRTDIEIKEDIVEEIGRLYGFDKLPLELPRRAIAPASKNSLLELKAELRQVLSRSGANEVLTYSFVHGNLLDKVGQSRELSFKLTNALSPDLQYYRQRLTPSLLDKVHGNIKAGFDQFALFEIGKAHLTSEVDRHESGLPGELEQLSLVVAADNKAAQLHGGAAYYLALKYLSATLQALGLHGNLKLKTAEAEDVPAYFEPARSATVWLDDHKLGMVGEYKAATRKALKLPDYCAGFEISIDVLASISTDKSQYQPLPKFPKTSQDLCLRVADSVRYQQVYDLAEAEVQAAYGDHIVSTITPVDIFQRDDDLAHKQITIRIALANYQKTLTDTEVTQLLDTIAARAAAAFAAERI